MSTSTSHPVSTKLKRALEALFEDPAPALQVLGAGSRALPGSWYEEALAPSVSASRRARMLCSRLESYIEQMAQESAELASQPDTERLQFEAKGLLIALREVIRHFPEVSES